MGYTKHTKYKYKYTLYVKYVNTKEIVRDRETNMGNKKKSKTETETKLKVSSLGGIFKPFWFVTG